MGSARKVSDVITCWVWCLWSSLVSHQFHSSPSFLFLKQYVKLFPLFSSAVDTLTNTKVAIKKLARPFQSAIHAKRTYRELRMLKHMNHENVIGLLDVFTPGTSLENFQVFTWHKNIHGKTTNL